MNIRPHVVCHVFAGLNGRIDGAYMLDPAASPARAATSALLVGCGWDSTGEEQGSDRGQASLVGVA